MLRFWVNEKQNKKLLENIDILWENKILTLKLKFKAQQALSPRDVVKICMCVFVCVCIVLLFSCVWLFCDPMDYSPPGSSVHGISQEGMLEWVAISFSRGSSWPRDWICVSCISCIGRWILYHWATREPVCVCVYVCVYIYIYLFF